MLQDHLLKKNPIRYLKPEKIEKFGAVIARAGVGKTAFMVQIALNTLLKGKSVLHISLTDPVKKVNLWYKEVFNLLSGNFDQKDADTLWENLCYKRLIMGFDSEKFSPLILEERIMELVDQNIFCPSVLIVDGLNFGERAHSVLEEIDSIAKKLSFQAWFTVTTHRHQEPNSSGMPVQLQGVEDLFKVVIQLDPESTEIRVKFLKGNAPDSPLFLDPATMLITNQSL